MTAQTILPANSASSGGYEVANSLRFNPASNDRLTRTPSTTGNESRWTWSGWAKRGTDNQDLFLFGCDEDANNETHLKFGTGGDIRFLDKVGGSTNGKINTLAKFRDLSAWYHIVAVFDKDNSTATDRMILYVNGVRISIFDGSVMPGNSSILNKAELVEIGALDGDGDMNGYICEVCFIDGQALAADSFGEFDSDSGIWVPIKVSGLTFGDQGYYLEMKQVGTSQNSSGMGADTSGNDNHFAVNGLTAIDQSQDTCTNNFCTLNPLDNFFPNHTYTDGNLTSASGTDNGSPYTYVTSTMGFNTGKWYWEFKAVAKESGIDNWVPGFTSQRTTTTTLTYSNGTHGYGMYGHTGVIYNNGSSAYGSGFTTGNTVMIAVDMDNLGAYWGVNGTWLNSSDPESGSNRTGAKVITAPTGDIGVYLPSWFWYEADVNGTASFNFGSPPYAISSGNADGNGYGNFEYEVPSGYFALCTKNLAEHG